MPDASCSKRPRPNGPEPDNTANPSKKQAVRKRAPLACEECRMRKRRCDGAVPICGGCTKRMSSCVYLAELQEKAWHHDMIKTLRNRLSELERADQQRQERDEIQSNHDDTIIVNNQDGSPRESGPELELSVSGCNQPSNHGQMLARPASSIAQHGNAVAVPAHSHTQILTSSVPVNLATPSGSASATSGGLEPGSVERLMRPIDQAIGGRSSDKDDISIPSITRSIPAATGPESSNPRPPCFCHQLLAAGEWSLPLRRQADDLVRLYFSRVHRMYPILHKPTFMKQYRQLWEPAATPSPTPPGHGPPKDQCSGLCRQKSRDKTFPAMVNAVFALASLFASGPPEENSARAGSFFSQAQQIDLLDIIDEEVGIELVQLLLLMGFYLQSTERFSKCWNITGLAIRMAQNMGLQLSALDARRKGLLVSSPTQLESEMRVRVWYGCVLLDNMNQTILQPPCTCVHYGQACRTRHSTESSYENPLHHHHFVVFPGLPAHLQPSDPVDPVPLAHAETSVRTRATSCITAIAPLANRSTAVSIEVGELP
ncbi:fungal-specific transcription factor domain-containing protein [Rhypophila decipiens]|uniref:Fungal-specific transcription factor domain-containing protein n=1 Tax=Rhypophila decipiens TaxID=261697 RepID=A0AAN6XS83_9PEZI|nr:fungal-specific transcription factor domain-containing protein [Rhypophila decipiens]